MFRHLSVIALHREIGYGQNNNWLAKEKYVEREAKKKTGTIKKQAKKRKKDTMMNKENERNESDVRRGTGS